MTGKIYINSAVIFLIILYLAISFFVLEDYGITIDDPPNIGIGIKYLHFYRTGHLDTADEIPVQKHGMPSFYDATVKKRSFVLWPLANTLAALSGEVFSQRLGLLEPVAGYHAVIPVLVAFFLYATFLFVRRHWGSSAGLIAVLLLISYPRFFGHTFSNIKDIPETIFFSVTVMLFSEWFFCGRIRFLYAGFFAFACTLATKMDAVLIPVIIGLWSVPLLVDMARSNKTVRARTLMHAVIGMLFSALIVWACYPPLYPGQPGKLRFLLNMLLYVADIGSSPNVGWNAYSLYYLLFATPPLMIAFFVFGSVWAIKRIKADRLLLLLLIWTWFPVLRHCMPGNSHYDGMRHFMVSLVPMMILVSLGIVHIGRDIARRLKKPAGWSVAFTGALCVVPNILILIALHPYQTTYFNFLIGGLGGAQARAFPYACDYWSNSGREAGRWIDANAGKGAVYSAYPHTALMPYNIRRKDLAGINIKNFLQSVPSNGYFVFIPKRLNNMGLPRSYLKEAFDLAAKNKPVYEVKRQGGIIFSICYFP